MIFFILQYSYSHEYCVELYLARHLQAIDSPILKFLKNIFQVAVHETQ